MLKNKKAIYILIPLNLIIWSFFIYRFYASYHTEDSELENRNIVSDVKLGELKDTLIYKLQLNYDDPFLKNQIRLYANSNQSNSGNEQTKRISSAIQNTSKQNNQIQKETRDIKYIGLIKNTDTGYMTALLSINGVSKLVKEKDVLDGITFKKFTRDSLVAFAGKERIVVRK